MEFIDKYCTKYPAFLTHWNTNVYLTKTPPYSLYFTKIIPYFLRRFFLINFFKWMKEKTSISMGCFTWCHLLRVLCNQIQDFLMYLSRIKTRWAHQSVKNAEQHKLDYKHSINTHFLILINRSICLISNLLTR